jgi:hypothetical protein
MQYMYLDHGHMTVNKMKVDIDVFGVLMLDRLVLGEIGHRNTIGGGELGKVSIGVVMDLQVVLPVLLESP